MPTPNPFESDVFSLTSLTAAINEPVEGQQVYRGADDLFNEEGISTKEVYIEMEGDTLSLVPSKAYGAPGDNTSLDKRKAKALSLIHLPTEGAVWAHEVQGVRAFGSENTAEAMEQKRNQVLAKMRRRLEATIAYHRIKALQGAILDADGSTELLNVFTFFGVTQQTKDFALGTAGTKVKEVLEQAKDLAADAVGGSAGILGFRCLAGRNWFNAFVGHSKIESAFDRYTGGAFLAQSQAQRGFEYADVEFRKVYGSVGGKDFIDADQAYLVPILDDPDAYITRFGPADYADTVNTMGLPFYSSSEMMKHNKGVELEAQTNVISVPTRPRAIIKLTKS